MKKMFVFSAFVLVFCLAETSYAAKVCLQDNFGAFWELKGGKIDKKSYTVKLFAGCILGGTAEITATNSGSFILSALTGNNDAGNCISVLWSATLNSNFAGSGSYDQLGNGTINGGFTLTPVNCSLLPSALTNEAKTVDPNSPVYRKQ